MRRHFVAVIVLSTAIALVGARPYAGGWNDASRLATVECIVDHGTFAIDQSIFVQPPTNADFFAPNRPELKQTGTLDRLWIDGRFYSDKTPVPAIILAGCYSVVQKFTGLTASESPRTFCWLMNFLGGGVPFVIAVVALFAITRHIGLSRGKQWLLTCCFLFGTIAPAYSRLVNNHIELLSTSMLLMWMMHRTGGPPFASIASGALAGLAYTIDLGIGPIMFAATGLFVTWHAWNRKSIALIMVFAMGAIPWLALHHAVNFSVAGTFGPANAKPEYFNWPGCPFDSTNMTGRWQHDGAWSLLLYALDLLVGKKGFLGHNLPLYLAVLAWPIVLLKEARLRALVLCSILWCVGAFLAYALTSNNYSGQCVSVRWFVPMLAPAFFVLAFILRHRPAFAVDLVILTGFSAIGSLASWWTGPWESPPLLLYWILLAGGLWSWAAWRLWRRKVNNEQILRNPRQTLQFWRPAPNNTVCRPLIYTTGE